MNATYKKVPVAKPERIALSRVTSSDSPSLAARETPIPPPTGLARQKIAESNTAVFHETCELMKFIPSEKAITTLWIMIAINTWSIYRMKTYPLDVMYNYNITCFTKNTTTYTHMYAYTFGHIHIHVLIKAWTNVATFKYLFIFPAGVSMVS